MFYNDPTTGERSGCIDPEIQTTGATRGVTVRTLGLEAILNSLPDRSEDSPSDPSSEE